MELVYGRALCSFVDNSIGGTTQMKTRFTNFALDALAFFVLAEMWLWIRKDRTERTQSILIDVEDKTGSQVFEMALQPEIFDFLSVEWAMVGLLFVALMIGRFAFFVDTAVEVGIFLALALGLTLFGTLAAPSLLSSSAANIAQLGEDVNPNTSGLFLTHIGLKSVAVLFLSTIFSLVRRKAVYNDLSTIFSAFSRDALTESRASA